MNAGQFIAPLVGAMNAVLPANRTGLAIVFYHVALGPNSTFDKWRGGVPVDYAPVMARAIEAARATHPEAHIVMLTDSVTEFDSKLQVEIVRLPVIADWVGYERTRAQLAFSRVWLGRAIHIDTDILLRRRFDDIFATGFDIGLTWRPHPEHHPINGGMLLCGNPPAFARFMADMVERIYAVAGAQKQESLLCCGGEQTALAAMVEGRGIGMYELAWGCVSIWHCDNVNHTTDVILPAADTGPYALHFKGPRKTALQSEPSQCEQGPTSPQTSLKAACAAQGTPYHEICFEGAERLMPRRYFAREKNWRLRQPYIYCGLVEDVHMFGRSFVYTRQGEHIFHGQSYQNHKEHNRRESLATFIHARKDLFAAHLKEECIFLGGMNVEQTPAGPSYLQPNSANFGHFIFEYLNRLVIFDMLGLLERLPVVIYDALPARYEQWLTLMGVQRLIRVPVSAPPAYRRAWVASAPHYRGADGGFRVWAAGHHWLRQKLFKAIGGPRLGARRRIYLGRGNAAWRRIVNEDELRPVLETHGFEFPDMAALPAREQLEIISGAEIVVAAGGANTILTHFAPEHCVIISLFPNPKIGTGLWGGVGASIVLGQISERIDGEEVASAHNQVNGSGANEYADYRVDCDQVARAVEASIAITEGRNDALAA